MPKFNLRDFEILKKSGIDPATVRMNVTHAIENSERIAADVHKLDANTGQYEITLRGTLKPESLDNRPSAS